MSKQWTERQKAVAYADRWFSRYIRARDHNRSIISGITAGQDVIQCGHVFTRQVYATRWDEENAYAVTHSENMRHEYDPWMMFSKVIEIVGRDVFDALYCRHRSPRKFTTAEIREIGKYYRDRYTEIEARDVFAS